MNHIFKKLLGLSDTLEPSGLAKPKANQTTKPQPSSTDYQDWFKNQTIVRMQKEIEERNRKDVEEKYRFIQMKVLEEEENRRSMEERHKKRISKVLNSFENQMDYVEDCLYELADMSEQGQSRRKFTQTHYSFSFLIRHVEIDRNSGTELSQTMFQVFSILKSANLRIKSRLPKSYITFAISGNLVVFNIYFSRKRISWKEKKYTQKARLVW